MLILLLTLLYWHLLNMTSYVANVINREQHYSAHTDCFEETVCWLLSCSLEHTLRTVNSVQRCQHTSQLWNSLESQHDSMYTAMACLETALEKRVAAWSVAKYRSLHRMVTQPNSVNCPPNTFFPLESQSLSFRTNAVMSVGPCFWS